VSCKRCVSDKQRVFRGELAIHFPGWEGLNKPHVWVFPRMTICLDCGFVEFELLAEQLAQLKDGGQWPETARAS